MRSIPLMRMTSATIVTRVITTVMMKRMMMLMVVIMVMMKITHPIMIPKGVDLEVMLKACLTLFSAELGEGMAELLALLGSMQKDGGSNLSSAREVNDMKYKVMCSYRIL